MPGKRVSKNIIQLVDYNYYKGNSAKEIADMFSRPGKKPLLSAQNVEKRLRFATEHVSLPPEYWHDVIFSDETKIMLYYHDGLQRV